LGIYCHNPERVSTPCKGFFGFILRRRHDLVAFAVAGCADVYIVRVPVDGAGAVLFAAQVLCFVDGDGHWVALPNT